MPRRPAAAPRERSRRVLPLARPVTRADCQDGPRPCPWVSCRYHLAIDVEGERVVSTFRPDEEGDPDLFAMPETCALDVADRARDEAHLGGQELGLDEIAKILGIRKAVVKQIVDGLSAKLAAHREFLAAGMSAVSFDLSVSAETGYDALGYHD